jgi:hypothetical protein
MSETPLDLTPLLPSLSALQRLLDRVGGRGVIIGGVAASLIGQSRLTADIDATFLLSLADLPGLVEAAKSEGLLPRITNFDSFVRQHRMLLLHHPESGIHVDISLGFLPFEKEMVERSQVFQIGTLALRIPTPEDLIILKAVAHRPKDDLDIQAVIQNHPDLDKQRIEFWVRQFADVLETPEIWDDIARWLI